MEFQSLDEDIGALFEHLKAKFRHDEINKFLQYFSCPHDFYAFRVFIKNIIRVNESRHHIKFAEFDFLHEDFDDFIELAFLINDYLDNNPTPLKWQSKGTIRRDNLIGDHYLYAMLSGDEEIGDENWFSLKDSLAFIMIGSIKGYENDCKDGVVQHANSYIKPGCHSVRELEPIKYRSLAIPHPKHFAAIDAFLDELKKFRRDDTKWVTNYWNMVRTYIEQKEGYTRRYHNSRNLVAKVEKINISREGDEIPVHSINSVPDEQEAKQILRGGAHPDEYTNTEAIFDQNIQNNCNLQDSKTIIGEYAGKINGIIYAAQTIHYTSADLSPLDLSVLIESLSKGYVDATYSLPCGAHELLSLVALICFTGRSIQSLATLRFLNTKKFSTQKTPNLTWLYDANKLIIPTNIMSTHTKMSSDTKELIKISTKSLPDTRNEFYAVDMPSFVSAILNSFYQVWKLNFSNNGTVKSKKIAKTIAFTDATLLESAVSQYLRKLNTKYDSQLSINKLIYSFRSGMQWISDDLAEYALITNTRYNHSIVAAHYYSVEKARLNQVHTGVINHVLQQANWHHIKVLEDPSWTGYVGSKLGLNSNVLKDYIRSLKERVRSEKRTGDLVAIHNAYTTYIIKLLQFATGYRSVGSPLSEIDEINKDFRLILIRDKDSDDHFHTRVIPLADIVIQQLDEYRSYLKHLMGKLGYRKYLRANIQKLIENQNKKNSLPFLFYLTQQKRVSHISPSTIALHDDEAWSYPPNVNRHYLRTKLRESQIQLAENDEASFIEPKCSAELIDYFMGHWELGEEPFNRFAHISPLTLRTEMIKTINIMLQLDGWTVIGNPYG